MSFQKGIQTVGSRHFNLNAFRGISVYVNCTLICKIFQISSWKTDQQLISHNLCMLIPIMCLVTHCEVIIFLQLYTRPVERGMANSVFFSDSPNWSITDNHFCGSSFHNFLEFFLCSPYVFSQCSKIWVFTKTGFSWIKIKSVTWQHKK